VTTTPTPEPETYDVQADVVLDEPGLLQVVASCDPGDSVVEGGCNLTFGAGYLVGFSETLDPDGNDAFVCVYQTELLKTAALAIATCEVGQ
jgi:hypothetical protein